MKAIVDADELARVLRVVARVTPKRTQLPILTNVVLEAKAGRLRLLASNLEEWVGREIPARGVLPGTTTVSARYLRDLAAILKGAGPILLERETQQSFKWGSPAEDLLVMARPGNFVGHLAAIPAEDYPPTLRDLDLGDWGILAPASRLAVAA